MSHPAAPHRRLRGRRLLFAGPVVLILVGLAAARRAPSAPAPDATGNLLKNAGFEARGDPPRDWYWDAKQSAKGRVSLVGAPVHAGKWALALEPTAANTDAASPLAVGQGLAAQTFRGKTLHVSGWLGARDGAIAVLGLFVFGRDGRVVAGTTVEALSGDGALAPKEALLAVPDDPDATQVILVCAARGTAGRALFDDVRLAVGAPRRPPADLVDPGPPLQARIEVDAGRVVRPIPRTLYGINTEWTWDGNGLWDPARRRLRPELVQLTRDLGVTLIRFPGGTFSDFYHWRDGVGPQAGRATNPAMTGESPSRHSMGTDEIGELARQVGAGLLFTANAGSGTAEEAADWVRYTNAPGHQRVERWEIGNELYLNTGAPAESAVTKTPQAYAELCQQFEAAMRKADPRVKLGAIVSDNFWGAGSYKDWDPVVLGKVGGEIDFLAVHNAYAPMVASDSGQTVREVYRAVLAAPVAVRRTLRGLAAKARAAAPARARPPAIAVTEWGTLYHVLPSSRFVDHCKTLGSALYTASCMKAFMDTPEVDQAYYFKLVDPLFIGAIGKRGGQYAPNASYYALQLYTRHFGSTLVASSATGPTFSTPALGFVPEERNVPYLEAVASTSVDGKTLYVMVINKHFDRAIRARIALRGFRPAPAGTAWTLNGTGIDANTGTTPLTAPGIRWAKQAEDEANPRFYKGGPNEVWLRRTAVSGAGPAMEYAFPAHSVTCLELRR